IPAWRPTIQTRLAAELPSTWFRARFPEELSGCDLTTQQGDSRVAEILRQRHAAGTCRVTKQSQIAHDANYNCQLDRPCNALLSRRARAPAPTAAPPSLLAQRGFRSHPYSCPAAIPQSPSSYKGSPGSGRQRNSAPTLLVSSSSHRWRGQWEWSIPETTTGSHNPALRR